MGGNTKTLMVACLSPADNNYDETLSTLRYANRAKNIQNKPKINEDPKDALLRQYQEEIEKLKAMLAGQIPVSVEGLDSLQGRILLLLYIKRNSVPLTDKVQYLTFWWSYSNQTLTVSSSKDCSHFPDITCLLDRGGFNTCDLKIFARF